MIKLPSDYLEKLFASEPELPGKFFCFLATAQAERLHKVSSQVLEEALELALPPGASTRIKSPANTVRAHR